MGGGLLRPQVFLELCRNAEASMRKESDEQRRRLAWLQQEAPDVAQDPIPVHGGGDRYNTDPDQYVGKTGRMPHGWAKAAHIASLVHIDEMRSLLELFCL